MELSQIAQLSDRLLPDPDGRSWFDVLAQAAAAEGASLQDVLDGAQSQSAARARHLAWLVISENSSASPLEIGIAFNYNKSSVEAGIAAARKRNRAVEDESEWEKIPKAAATSYDQHPILTKLAKREVTQGKLPTALASEFAKLNRRIDSIEDRLEAIETSLGEARTCLDLFWWCVNCEGAFVRHILEHRKFPSATRARHRLWWEMKRRTSASNVEIGAIFESTPSAVRYGIAEHERRIAKQASSGKENGGAFVGTPSR